MISSRLAGIEDLPELLRLYRLLESEMVGLHEMWPIADGLPEPVEDALRRALNDPEKRVILGFIDEVPCGFILAGLQGLLPQADEERVGVVKLVFTEPEARAVGIAEVMIDLAMSELETLGAERFDAPVLPGHRLAKNFFERSGFSARSIVMHRRKQ